MKTYLTCLFRPCSVLIPCSSECRPFAADAVHYTVTRARIVLGKGYSCWPSCLAGQEAIRWKSLLLYLVNYSSTWNRRQNSDTATLYKLRPLREHQPIRPLPLCIAPVACHSFPFHSFCHVSPSSLSCRPCSPRFSLSFCHG